MAHYQQQRFVEIVAENLPHFFQGSRVLEVGSWDANGSVRHRFSGCEYIGADVAPGPGVDLVCPGQRLDFSDGYFDVVMSLECFEHNPEWRATFKNMVRMLRPGGLCIVTCACIGRGEHGTQRRAPNSSLTVLTDTKDHYANLRKADLMGEGLADEFGASYRLFYNRYFYDLYFVGVKWPGGQIPMTLEREVRSITEEGADSLGRRLNVLLTFWGTYLFARLLGERRYHDFKFGARQMLRRLGSRR